MQFYNWRSRFGGLDTSVIKRHKELEVENNRLKKMYVEELINADIRQEVTEEKLYHHLDDVGCQRSWQICVDLVFD